MQQALAIVADSRRIFPHSRLRFVPAPRSGFCSLDNRGLVRDPGVVDIFESAEPLHFVEQPVVSFLPDLCLSFDRLSPTL
jgi:hypothetical protein